MIDFEIAGRAVGEDAPPLVIAEVGINHEGDVEKAFACVDAAARAGAEVVKFQCHITAEEMVPTDIKPGNSDDRIWDIIDRCVLDEDEERRVQAYCAEHNIVYMSTPFSRAAADRLEDMNVPAYKIGSGECNALPLLDHIASFGKPIILSTGMNDLQSVKKSVEVIRRHNTPLALLHCTSMYPTPYDKVRLGAISELRETFPDLPIGLSDHSLGNWTCFGAVSLGASLLEKHFTPDRNWQGPDIEISITPDELSDLISGSKAVWEASGGSKTILPEEQVTIDFAYATVVTIAPIKAGEAFSKDNIWIKRPGTGKIHASDFEDLLGRIATRDLPTDIHVDPGDVAD